MKSTLFPCTTLFRSPLLRNCAESFPIVVVLPTPLTPTTIMTYGFLSAGVSKSVATGLSWADRSATTSSLRRSEEHTSELQSRENLVCRLLLERKKYL